MDPSASHQQLLDGDPQEPVKPQKHPEQQVEQPEGGLLSVSLELEESVPSTSGLSSSTKRSREESDREQVSTNFWQDWRWILLLPLSSQ